MDKKEMLFGCAKELFSESGFKDTNVADITKKAGMATGTFYNYYPSKDELFMEIFMDENRKLKHAIIQKIDDNGDPAQVMSQMMYLNFTGMMENPILKEWYNRDVFSKIEQNFRKGNGIQAVDFLYDAFIEVVKIWQTRGKIRSDIKSEMIMAIFAGIVNIDAHKEEVGLQYFPQVLEYITEFVMKGLTDCQKEK